MPDAAGHGVRDAGGAGQRQRQAVERAQVEGDLSPEKDARAVARYLVSSRSGLKTMAKAGAARETLQDIITLVYATLGW